MYTISSVLPMVDMGAYEYQADCNNNGVIDAVDIVDGTRNDRNTNGIPYECESMGDSDDDVDVDLIDFGQRLADHEHEVDGRVGCGPLDGPYFCWVGHLLWRRGSR